MADLAGVEPGALVGPACLANRCGVHPAARSIVVRPTRVELVRPEGQHGLSMPRLPLRHGRKLVGETRVELAWDVIPQRSERCAYSVSPLTDECTSRDLNPELSEDTSTSSWRVCRFRHSYVFRCHDIELSNAKTPGIPPGVRENVGGITPQRNVAPNPTR